MDLPLFKGVGKDHISLFLEKTNIGFHNYESGERIVETGDVVRMVRFIISGEVRIIHRLEEASLTVEERCGFGKVLGADRLFGMETGYPYDVVAVGKTSVMEFSKEQYINLLHSDNIYMLNFFNYLSLRAQRPVDCLR
ncbi:MAG: cyclic nucleotide-binding domain-containing protein, partial [Muribaculaceae bacterium]|nr:cyclic nucleotide-binding domain-containing protein [Muribaculaceae bacterium]